MEKTSFRGTRIGIPLFFMLALSVCSAAETYRLKKTAEIKHWQKALSTYSVELDTQNKTEIQNIQQN